MTAVGRMLPSTCFAEFNPKISSNSSSSGKKIDSDFDCMNRLEIHVHLLVTSTKLQQLGFQEEKKNEEIFKETLYDDEEFTLMKNNVWLKKKSTFDQEQGGLERSNWSLKQISKSGSDSSYKQRFILFEQSHGKKAIDMALEISQSYRKREIHPVLKDSLTQDLIPLLFYFVWRRTFRHPTIEDFLIRLDSFGWGSAPWKFTCTLITKPKSGESEDQTVARINQLIIYLNARICPSRVHLKLEENEKKIFDQLINNKIFQSGEQPSKEEMTISKDEKEKCPFPKKMFNDLNWEEWLVRHPDYNWETIELIDDRTVF